MVFHAIEILNKIVGRMDTSPVLSASGSVHLLNALAQGNISFKFPHHWFTLPFKVLFSSVIHTYSRERIAFATSDSHLFLPKGYQNLLASHGCSIRRKAESTVVTTTIKPMCGKWWGKMVSFPSNHDGCANYKRQLVPKASQIPTGIPLPLSRAVVCI